MPDPPEVSDPIWTAPQRRAIVILLSLLLVFLTGRYACNRAFIDDPQPEVNARAADLADKLDPNTADWRELAAIPNLGEKKAQAIVAFREKWQAQHPQDPAFRGPEDLRQVKGIGPATASNLKPYLIFPKPTTRSGGS
jgi:competence ComEA-like helix-hairpin-helix protein